MDVGRIPAVGGVDVVRTRGRYADQIGQRPQQHVVARPRPGIVEERLVGVVESGVEEEIERHPAAARRDSEPRQRRVEVVGAVDMAGITHVGVVLLRACVEEAVVPAAGVADHLDHRLEVLVIAFREQARRRTGTARQRAGRGRVQAEFQAAVETGHGQGLEIRTLPTLHVDDLDELAGPDLVGFRGASGDATVDARVGQGLRHRMLGGDHRTGAGHEDLDPGRGILPVDPHRRPRRRHETHQRPLGGERRLVARTRVSAQNLDRPRRGRVETPSPQATGKRTGPGVIATEDRLQTFGGSVRRDPQRSGVGGAIRREGRKLGGLPPLPVADRDGVARLQGKDDRPAPPGDMAFHSEAEHGEARQEDGAGGRGPLRQRRRPGIHRTIDRDPGRAIRCRDSSPSNRPARRPRGYGEPGTSCRSSRIGTRCPGTS